MPQFTIYQKAFGPAGVAGAVQTSLNGKQVSIVSQSIVGTYDGTDEAGALDNYVRDLSTPRRFGEVSGPPTLNSFDAYCAANKKITRDHFWSVKVEEE